MPIDRSPAVSTRAASRERTRGRILDAAHAAFSERGYHRVSLKHIAARAGCTTGAIYSNFATKDDLFLAVLEKQIKEQESAWDEYIGTSCFPGSIRDFGAAMSATTPGAQWAAAWMEFIALASGKPELRSRVEDIHRRVLSAWERRLAALDSSLGRASPLPVSMRALLVSALANGLATWGHADSSVSANEAFVEGLSVLSGYGPLPSGGR